MFIPHVGTDTRILVVVALFCVGLGSYTLYRGYTAGELVHVDLAALEAGQSADATWIEVDGIPHEEWAYHEEAGELVPIVSPTWSVGKPLVVFLSRRSTENPMPHEVKVIRGTRPVGRGFGINQRKEYQRRAMPVAGSPILLDPGKTPDDIRNEGLWWFGGGVVGLWVYRLLPKRWKRDFLRPYAG